MKPDRGLADALDQIEDVGAFLVADGVAQDAAKQADIVPQPQIFFERGGFLAAIRFQSVFRKHDLAGHR